MDILDVYDMGDKANLVYPLLALSSVIVKIPVGAMLDYISPHYLLSISVMLVGLSFILLQMQNPNVL